MITLKNNQQEIILTIEGYAYPFSRDDWDSNWLSVKIEIKDFINNIQFENNDNCLLTMELEDLKNWFVLILAKPNSEILIKFMEPNLKFYYSEKKIKIQLQYDFNPNYDNSTIQDLDNAYILEFNLEKEKTEALIKKLENSIIEYPKRNNPR